MHSEKEGCSRGGRESVPGRHRAPQGILCLGGSGGNLPTSRLLSQLGNWDGSVSRKPGMPPKILPCTAENDPSSGHGQSLEQDTNALPRICHLDRVDRLRRRADVSMRAACRFVSHNSHFLSHSTKES